MNTHDDTPCPKCSGTGTYMLGYAELRVPRYCSDCYGTGIAGMTMTRLEAEAKLAREGCPAHGVGCADWAEIHADETEGVDDVPEAPAPRPARRLAAAGALMLALALTGCTAAPVAAPAPTTAPVVEVQLPMPEALPVEPEPIKLAVVGDSITSWSPPFAADPGQSWVFTATSNDMPLVGGWALPGAKLAEMQAAVTPADADVLVIMGGTNDLYAGTPVEARLASIDAIAATIGADEVVLSSTAPYGFDWAAGVQWNAELAAHAEARGWHYIDPWAGVRQPNGAWYPTTDYGDGVHPNPTTATYIGGVIRDAIVELAR